MLPSHKTQVLQMHPSQQPSSSLGHGISSFICSITSCGAFNVKPEVNSLVTVESVLARSNTPSFQSDMHASKVREQVHRSQTLRSTAGSIAVTDSLSLQDSTYNAFGIKANNSNYNVSLLTNEYDGALGSHLRTPSDDRHSYNGDSICIAWGAKSIDSILDSSFNRRIRRPTNELT